MIEEIENPVIEEEEEITENVEEVATEETTEEVEEELPKTYTEEELNARVDELLAKKIARKERKLRKEYDSKYGELVNVLKAGTGEDDIDSIKDSFTDFYTRKGVKIPSMSFNDDDLARLGNDDAEDIIEEGYDAIKEETDRLASIGKDNMNARERATFMKLAAERTLLEEKKELAALGIGRAEIESEDFIKYNAKLNPELSLKERYEMYQNSKPKKQIEQMGSMKSGNVSKVKDYYSPAEIEKLTEEDLSNPEVWEAVRKSMTGRA